MYSVERFGIDVSEFDIIEGWRTNDAYFAYVDAIFSVGLSIEGLLSAMKFGDLGLQICLKSERAFSSSQLRFVAAHKAASSEFYKNAKQRDNEARLRYKNMRNKTDGTLIIDIIGR